MDRGAMGQRISEVTLTPVQRRIIDYALINVEIFGN